MPDRQKAVRGSILVVADGIYRRYPGGKLVQLTKEPADRFPAWSRDGTKIAFERLISPGLAAERCPLLVMNSDGSDLHPVGDVNTDCSGAGWGPGDRQLVFGGGPPHENNATLWVVNADGTGATQLVHGPGATPEGTHPAWSPDGETIVFGWTASRVNGLLAIRPDGTRLRALVKPRPRHVDVFTQPAWSRDGKRLAFVHVDLGARKRAVAREIVAAAPDGRQRQVLARLPLNPGEMGAPTWSPNGSHVAFSGICGRRACVWTIPSRGGKRQTLLRGVYLQASWGPAGT